MKLLNVLDAGHRANRKGYPLNNEKQINIYGNQLYNQFGNINDNTYLNLVQCKIKDLNNSELKN